jgi:hypothetical protein
MHMFVGSLKTCIFLAEMTGVHFQCLHHSCHIKKYTFRLCKNKLAHYGWQVSNDSTEHYCCLHESKRSIMGTQLIFSHLKMNKTPLLCSLAFYWILTLVCSLNFSLWNPCLIYSCLRLPGPGWDWCCLFPWFTCRGTSGEIWWIFKWSRTTCYSERWCTGSPSRVKTVLRPMRLHLA